MLEQLKTHLASCQFSPLLTEQVHLMIIVVQYQFEHYYLRVVTNLFRSRWSLDGGQSPASSNLSRSEMASSKQPSLRMAIMMVAILMDVVMMMTVVMMLLVAQPDNGRHRITTLIMMLVMVMIMVVVTKVVMTAILMMVVMIMVTTL